MSNRSAGEIARETAIAELTKKAILVTLLVIIFGILIAIGFSVDWCKSAEFRGFFFTWCEESQPESNNTPQYFVVTATPQPQANSDNRNSSSYVGQAQYEMITEHFYQGASVDLSAYPAANSDQIYLIHGDIQNDAQCKIVIFGHGHRPNEYSIGVGGWRLVRITGTDEQISAMINTVQSGAANHAGGSCPILASIGW